MSGTKVKINPYKPCSQIQLCTGSASYAQPAITTIIAGVILMQCQRLCAQYICTHDTMLGTTASACLTNAANFMAGVEIYPTNNTYAEDVVGWGQASLSWQAMSVHPCIYTDHSIFSGIFCFFFLPPDCIDFLQQPNENIEVNHSRLIRVKQIH